MKHIRRRISYDRFHGNVGRRLAIAIKIAMKRARCGFDGGFSRIGQGVIPSSSKKEKELRFQPCKLFQ